MSRFLTSALAVLCLLAVDVCVGQDTAQDQQDSQYDLLVRFATAKRDLAKIELKRAVAKKEAIPAFTVARLRSQVSVAEEHLRQTTVAATGGAEAVRRRHAEEQVRLAKMEFEAGKKLRTRTSNFSDLDLASLKLKYEVAKLKVELIDNPATYMTLMDSMEQRMDQFSEEILTLEQRIARLENPGR